MCEFYVCEWRLLYCSVEPLVNMVLICLFKPDMFHKRAHPDPHNVLYIYRHTFEQPSAHQPHILYSLSLYPQWDRVDTLS